MNVVRKITQADIDFIATNARQSDKDEALLLSGHLLEDILNFMTELYKDGYTWVVDGIVVCIFGVTPTSKKEGIIWFLATDDFEKNRFLFKRVCRQEFKKLVKKYTYLYNYIYEGHEVALDWVKSLGFKVYPAQPIGAYQDMFCKFEVSYV